MTNLRTSSRAEGSDMADEAQVKRLAEMLQNANTMNLRTTGDPRFWNELSHRLLEAGVKLPEPKYHVELSGMWGVYKRGGSGGWVVRYDNTHPNAEAAARAECARLNGEVG